MDQDNKETNAGAAGSEGRTVDIAGIMRAIPHRYPFLLVDRVIELVPDVSAVGIKNVSINEAFFEGHFPSHPVMPGVLIIESMAQTAAVLVVETLGPESAGKLVYFMSVENAKFRRPWGPETSSASTSSSNGAAAMSGNSKPLPKSMAWRWPKPPMPR
jgi:3-hydroxyacyl-[acyl-carrier-protein] dehydratase